MRPPAVAAVAALLLCAAASAQQVSLAPAPAEPAIAPYQPATLTIDRTADPTGPVVTRVDIADAAGGPTLRYPVAAAGGAVQSLPVVLTALTAQNEYRVRMFAGHQLLVERQAAVQWPPQPPGAASFVDPELLMATIQPRPTWPDELLRSVLLSAALTALTAGSVLLVRRPGVRLAMLAAVLLAATAASWHICRSSQVVVERRLTAPDGAALVAVASRRSTTFALHEGLLAPVYRSTRQMMADDAVIAPAGTSIIPMQPDRVRLLRLLPAGQSPPVTAPAALPPAEKP
jgi:hypothetical protein